MVDGRRLLEVQSHKAKHMLRALDPTPSTDTNQPTLKSVAAVTEETEKSGRVRRAPCMPSSCHMHSSPLRVSSQPDPSTSSTCTLDLFSICLGDEKEVRVWLPAARGRAACQQQHSRNGPLVCHIARSARHTRQVTAQQ